MASPLKRLDIKEESSLHLDIDMIPTSQSHINNQTLTNQIHEL